MMCYKDMTFCPFYEDCQNRMSCHRPLTPQVKADAEKWWGQAGAPIASYAEKPECHKQVEKSND